MIRTIHSLTTITIPGFAPEDTLLGPDGMLYTGLRNDGTIIRIDINQGTATELAEVGGMPLGLEWMPDGRMLICNAMLGLQMFDIATRKVEAHTIKGPQLHLANNASIGSDGTIYVSDSSTAYPLADYRRDIIEDTRSGRLLKVTPNGEASILLDGLSFANGVALLPDGKSVLVAETAKSRIHKVNIDGSDPMIFAQTPGLPDNLSVGTDGLIWTALPSRPNAALSRLHSSPLFIRKLTSMIPANLQPNAVDCCWIVAYDVHANLVHHFEGDTKVFSHVTGVREVNGRVYLGSIEHDRIAWFDVADCDAG